MGKISRLMTSSAKLELKMRLSFAKGYHKDQSMQHIKTKFILSQVGWWLGWVG